MRKQYNFNLLENVTHNNDLIKNYFCHHGFVVQTEEDNKLLFIMRGNLVTHLLLNNPLRWSSQIIVLRRGSEIFLHANIFTFTNRINKKAERIWNCFFLGLERSVKKDQL